MNFSHEVFAMHSIEHVAFLFYLYVVLSSIMLGIFIATGLWSIAYRKKFGRWDDMGVSIAGIALILGLQYLNSSLARSAWDAYPETDTIVFVRWAEIPLTLLLMYLTRLWFYRNYRN